MEEPLQSCCSSGTWPAARPMHADLPQDVNTGVVSHQRRSRQRRTRYHTTRTTAYGIRTTLLAVLTVISLSAQCTAALAIPVIGSELLPDEGFIFDSTPAPIPRTRITRRSNEAAFSATTVITANDATATGQKSTSTSDRDSTTLVVDETTSSVTLPRPFDTTLGNNFTASTCPTFFETFLANTTFNDCLPLSLLLQSSSSFFATERSPVLLSQTLDATCNVNLTQCNSLMATLAHQIKDNSNCGADYIAENPMVLQAYNGFIAYEPLYHAGCLKNDDTGNYCFSDAATNASSPTSSYIYFLPLGVNLPAKTSPTCNSCMQNTMAIFAAAASNATQPVSGDYAGAAKIIDAACGADFVNASVAITSGALPGIPQSSLLRMSLLPVVAAITLTWL